MHNTLSTKYTAVTPNYTHSPMTSAMRAASSGVEMQAWSKSDWGITPNNNNK
jgi:hypothetical protein